MGEHKKDMVPDGTWHDKVIVLRGASQGAGRGTILEAIADDIADRAGTALHQRNDR